METPFIEKSCKVKKHYARRKQALDAMGQLLAHSPSDVPMNVYKCRFCKDYHVGHAPWLLNERIEGVGETVGG